MINNSTRRYFIKRSAAITAGVLILPQIIPSTALGMGGKLPPSNRVVMGAIGTGGQATPVAAAVKGTLFRVNARILFQGDSITDGERNRNECPHLLLGQGYQFIIAARFSALYPERKVTFINRAILSVQGGAQVR